MLRAMWRVLETELRTLLVGHEGGNAGHRQEVSYGLPRQHSTLPPQWRRQDTQGSCRVRWKRMTLAPPSKAGRQPIAKLFTQTSYRTSRRLLVICPRATAIESTDSVVILPMSGSPTRSPLQPVPPVDVLSVHGTSSLPTVVGMTSHTAWPVTPVSKDLTDMRLRCSVISTVALAALPPSGASCASASVTAAWARGLESQNTKTPFWPVVELLGSAGYCETGT